MAPSIAPSGERDAPARTMAPKAQSAAEGSKIAVYGALVGNLAIAVTKFIAAGVTGSAAMLAEGIHSTVDTADEVLLLVGIRRSKRPPDAEHPFGHGKELYFWSLLVAVLIFGAGGGVSAYEGILHILRPVPLRDPTWNYVVLAAAFVFEGASLAVSIHAFVRHHDPRRGLWTSFLESKDPAIYTVIVEDSAALAGLVLAFGGVFASHRLHLPVLDGAASLAVGLLLAGVATFLIWQCRGLLVGVGVRPETARQIREIASGVEGVEKVASPRTMYLGPESVLLALDVRFRPDAPASEVEVAVDRIESRIRERYPLIKHIYIEAESVGRRTGALPPRGST